MRILALLMFAQIAATAQAGVCADTESCLRLVEAQQRSTQVLSARIVQTKHLSLLTEPLVSRGRFAFKQPDLVVWQLDDPPLTVRIDSSGLHLPGRPQAEKEVAALAPFNRVMGEFAGIFTGNLEKVRGAFAVQARGGDAEVQVEMVPQQETWRRMFQRIELTFVAPGYVIRSIRLQESLGDRLEIEFSDVHRNDAVAEAAVSDQRPQ